MNDLTKKYAAKKGKHNPNLVLLHKEVSNYRHIILQGGTRSGKTYSVLHWIVYLCTKYKGLKIAIVRKTLPAVKSTSWADMESILKEAGFYKKQNHNKTEKVYYLNGNEIHYFGADDENKVRGFKCDILYLNECIELEYAIVKQLRQRCSGKIIYDYNPSEDSGWVYTDLYPRDNAVFIKTTYLNNPHLTRAQIEEIEWYKDNDPTYWSIYGLGEKATPRGAIYTGWKRISKKPEELIWTPVIDFGYSPDPCAIIECARHNRSLYANELHYANNMTNFDVAVRLATLGYNSDNYILADNIKAEIQSLRQGYSTTTEAILKSCATMGVNCTDENAAKYVHVLASGFSVMGSIKGAGSVLSGINKVQGYEVFVTDNSVNTWREYSLYKYKIDKSTDKILGDPIDNNNHSMDCIRYFSLNENRI